MHSKIISKGNNFAVNSLRLRILIVKVCSYALCTGQRCFKLYETYLESGLLF